MREMTYGARAYETLETYTPKMHVSYQIQFVRWFNEKSHRGKELGKTAGISACQSWKEEGWNTAQGRHIVLWGKILAPGIVLKWEAGFLCNRELALLAFWLFKGDMTKRGRRWNYSDVGTRGGGRWETVVLGTWYLVCGW